MFVRTAQSIITSNSYDSLALRHEIIKGIRLGCSDKFDTPYDDSELAPHWLFQPKRLELYSKA